ncbi:hypothetical protein MYP14_11130 [Rhodococcus pyridinivorans]|uniref:hypothetical protein n=1 Tax=Rhodococcus TaxID=1827 RepID=UPI000B2AC1DA|nr:MULTISPECIES: hypothetical protein [Rhodococcus]UPK65822.1 hypothetical protein MYP14_11130 [Rhodococcus pyridinivorans]
MPDVYYWCRGQDDNIGDVLLRRRFLRELRCLGEVHVLIGGASEGFIDAMSFDKSDVLYRSQTAWLKALYHAVIRRGVVLAANPGEVRVDRKSAVAYGSIIPAQILSRWRGGKSLQLGVAVKGKHSVLRIPVTIFGRNSDLQSFREEVEASPDAPVYPDWAFDESRDTHGVVVARRDVCAVTYRVDRPMLSESALDALRRVCSERDLKIVVFSQVRRDNSRTRELASALGGDVLMWEDDVSHSDQERKIRDLMAHSEVVVSDRIHALIMGTSEGATPLGLIPGSDVKVAPHFAAASIAGISGDITSLGTHAVADFIRGVIDRRTEIEARVDMARARVADLGEAVRSVNAGVRERNGSLR